MSTAPNGYQTPKTNWASADVPTPSDFNRVEGNIQAIESGSRTIDPAQAPSGNVGTLRQLLDWFANRIKAILGTTNWYDAPPTTLQAAKTHFDALAPHAGHETPAGAQQKVDAAISDHISGDPHPQYALDSDVAAKVAKAGDTMTGVLKLPNGTAAAPALAFSSEPDVGIYCAGTDILAFAAGGAERFRIDTGGPKVGSNAVWHAGNDGAGSGLNADLLDGYHASSFAIAPIPVTSLKKAQGSSSAVYFGVHQYTFASPAYAAHSSYAMSVLPGAVNKAAGTVRYWAQAYKYGEYNWDSSYDRAVYSSSNVASTVTWDYLTASGHPRIWAIVDDADNIISMWEAEDPADEEFPDECPIGLTDEKSSSIIPVGGAVVPLQFPTEQQLVALKDILVKTPMPQFASRGIWVHHKTPEGIVQAIFDKEMGSRGLEPIPDVREALFVQDIDKRNWRIQLWLRGVSRVKKGHRAFTLIPLFETTFRVDKRTGTLEFK